MSYSKKIRSALLARGTNVSARTVCRRLVSDFGLKSCKPAKNPVLPMQWRWNDQPLRSNTLLGLLHSVPSAIFTGESSTQQFSPRQRHVPSSVRKRFDERYTVHTMNDPPSVMILWSPGPGYRLTLIYPKIVDLKIICAMVSLILLKYLFINNIDIDIGYIYEGDI